MTVQVSARALGDRERTTFARSAGSFVNMINGGFKAFGARFAAALHESRRRECDRLYRRYIDLIDNPGA